MHVNQLPAEAFARVELHDPSKGEEAMDQLAREALWAGTLAAAAQIEANPIAGKAEALALLRATQILQSGLYRFHGGKSEADLQALAEEGLQWVDLRTRKGCGAQVLVTFDSIYLSALYQEYEAREELPSEDPRMSAGLKRAVESGQGSVSREFSRLVLALSVLGRDAVDYLFEGHQFILDGSRARLALVRPELLLDW